MRWSIRKNDQICQEVFTLGRGMSKVSYDELHTAIVEVEAIVNSTPLSYVHPDDHEQPLTPLRLLVGRRLLSLPDYLNHLEPEDNTDFELTAESLQR